MKHFKVPKIPEITKIPFQDEAGQFLLNPLKLKFVSRRRSKNSKRSKVPEIPEITYRLRKTENLPNPNYN